MEGFELWCWRRPLRVPWTLSPRRSNQSILKEINPDYLLEGLLLKLKFQYFGHLMWRAGSLEKTLMPGNIEGRRRRGPFLEMVGWHHRLNGPESEQAPGDGEGQGSLAGCSPRGCSTGLQRVGHDGMTELNWTELNLAAMSVSRHW